MVGAASGALAARRFPLEVRLRLRRSHDDFERIIFRVEAWRTSRAKPVSVTSR